MIRLGRKSSAGPGLASWPVMLCLALGVLIPSAALLWFMNQAIQNERLAMNQRLADGYQAQLRAADAQIESFLQERLHAASRLAETNAPAAAFHAIVMEKLADAAVLVGSNRDILYPNAPRPAAIEANASRADSAHALLAESRAHREAGRRTEAIGALLKLSAAEYEGAVDSQGRLITPNAELAALEMLDRGSPQFDEISDRLGERLRRYDLEMTAAQRRFLMQELQRLSGGEMRFPTLASEILARRFADSRPNLERFGTDSQNGLISIRAGSVILIFNAASETNQLRESLRLFEGVRLSAPGEPLGEYAAARPASSLPGWTLGMMDASGGIMEAAQARIAAYLWMGGLVVLAIAALSLGVARVVTRQVKLARLKSDLVANVTHELKTPLASTRLLVDTLLASDTFNPETTRQYLELIARENRRLSNLIENFLAFSRMERNKHAFDLRRTFPEEIVRSAADAIADKFAAAGCEFEVECATGLPEIRADADSLITAILNLLDNAFKYSGKERRIVLRARSGRDAGGPEDALLIEVEDNGIGITADKFSKIFRRFYQVDQSLARESSGCGLGLSIVDFIVKAHHGKIEVESEQGRGSLFRIVLPAIRAEKPELAKI